MPNAEWAQTWAARVLHVVLVFGSAYVAANPKYVWVIPALQALGQGIPQPK